MPVNNGMEPTRKHVFLLGQWRNHPISDVKDPCPKLNRPKDREAANEWFIVHISPPTTGAHYPSEFVWQFFVVLIQKKVLLHKGRHSIDGSCLISTITQT